MRMRMAMSAVSNRLNIAKNGSEILIGATVSADPSVPIGEPLPTSARSTSVCVGMPQTRKTCTAANQRETGERKLRAIGSTPVESGTGAGLTFGKSTGKHCINQTDVDA